MGTNLYSIFSTDESMIFQPEIDFDIKFYHKIIKFHRLNVFVTFKLDLYSIEHCSNIAAILQYCCNVTTILIILLQYSALYGSNMFI